MRLRRLEQKDAEGMLEWMHDPDIQKNFRFSFERKTIKEVLDFIHSSTIIPKENGDVHFAIVNNQDEYMGTISLKKIDCYMSNAEYAICLRKVAQRNGIAEKATREILRIAFEEWDLHRIYLNVISDNYRAIKLYEKCGFVYEGEMRQHLYLGREYKSLKYYGILKSEYRGCSNFIHGD